MCCTQDAFERCFGGATPKSIKCWRIFIISFLILSVIVPLRFSLAREFENSIPSWVKPEIRSEVLLKDGHDEAKQILLATTKLWEEETFIVGISLQTEKCGNPAFTRVWHGTAPYETEVIIEPTEESRRLAERNMQDVTGEADESVDTGDLKDTLDDLQEMIAALEAQLKLQEARDFIEKYDTNSNGLLDIDELQAFAETQGFDSPAEPIEEV